MARSARRTAGESRSMAWWTMRPWRPSLFVVRRMRTAISPRLATNTDLKGSLTERVRKVRPPAVPSASGSFSRCRSRRRRATARRDTRRCQYNEPRSSWPSTDRNVKAANMSRSDRFDRTDEELAATQPALRDGYFNGKVILISGAGSGIGRALAHWAARLGAEVVLCGRNAAKLTDAAAAIGRYGVRTMVHALTIRDPSAVSQLFEAAWGQFGRVDVLINNAGGQFPSPALDINPKGWQAVVDTNLNGTWYMMQAAAQCWRRGGLPGSLVNIVAVIGRGTPGIAHTCA